MPFLIGSILKPAPPSVPSLSYAVDSGGAGGSEKGQSLISAYRSLAIAASTSGFEKLVISKLTEEIQSITAVSERGSYAKPLLVQALSSHSRE